MSNKTLEADTETRDYGPECTVVKRGTQEVRCPAFPHPVSYIRVISDGQEVIYWSADEWAVNDSAMGAILGCIKQVAEGRTVAS